MSGGVPRLGDDFSREPPYPPDYLFPGLKWSGLGDLDALRFLERKLRAERLVALSYVRLQRRLGFALLTSDMQGRWKAAYDEAFKSNTSVLQDLVAVLPALGRPVVLFGALGLLCTLYEDCGMRPVQTYRLLVEEPGPLVAALADRSWQHSEGILSKGGLRLVVHQRLVWPSAALDAAAVMARAVAPVVMPPLPESFQLPPEAAGIDTEPAPPPRPRAPRADERALETLRGVVRVPALSDALLVGAVQWVQALPSEGWGIWAWELSEVVRRGSVDWDALHAEAGRLGVTGSARAVLGLLGKEWRAEVPASLADEAAGKRLAEGRLRRADGWRTWVPTSDALRARGEGSVLSYLRRSLDKQEMWR